MWKDVTSYSRNDKERKPTTFEVREGALRVVITCGHISYRPQWVMHCNALSIDTYPLKKGLSKEQAEAEAMSVVFQRLADLTQCADKLLPNA